jgi:hypothetical protein
MWKQTITQASSEGQTFDWHMNHISTVKTCKIARTWDILSKLVDVDPKMRMSRRKIISIQS